MTAAALRHSRNELDALIASLCLPGAHIRAVTWQDGPVWLKLSVPQPPAWRYTLVGAPAGLSRRGAMPPVRPQGGFYDAAARLTALAHAGIRAPAILERGADWLPISGLGQTTPGLLIRHAGPIERVVCWQRGADYTPGRVAQAST